MLKSFEAIYDQGQLYWLEDAPEKSRMKVIMTVIENLESSVDIFGKRRQPPPALLGKMRILCDEKTLMKPVIPEDEKQ